MYRFFDCLRCSWAGVLQALQDFSCRKSALSNIEIQVKTIMWQSSSHSPKWQSLQQSEPKMVIISPQSSHSLKWQSQHQRSHITIVANLTMKYLHQLTSLCIDLTSDRFITSISIINFIWQFLQDLSN